MPRRLVTFVTCSFCKTEKSDEDQEVIELRIIAENAPTFADRTYDVCEECWLGYAALGEIWEAGEEVLSTKKRSGPPRGEFPCGQTGCTFVSATAAGAGRHRLHSHGILSATAKRKAASAKKTA